MSDDRKNVPDYVERETTGVTEARTEARVRTANELGRVQGELAEYKRSTPTFKELRDEVSGARTSITSSIESKIVNLARVETVANLQKEVEENKPPKFWHLLTMAASVIGTVVLITWNVSGRVSDMALQNALLARDVSDLREAVKRLEVTVSSTSSKLDAFLIRVIPAAKP